MVNVRLTDAGWFINYNGHSIGPFDYLNEVDEITAAEKLGVAPKHIFLAKMKASSRLSRPVKLPSPECISINKNVVVIPSFKDAFLKVHPAIDIAEDKAYVGIYLPCTVQRKRENEEIENHSEELPFLITDLHEKILAEKEKLNKLKLKLAYRPLSLNRWRLNGVATFLEGKEAVDPPKFIQQLKQHGKNTSTQMSPASMGS